MIGKKDGMAAGFVIASFECPAKFLLPLACISDPK